MIKKFMASVLRTWRTDISKSDRVLNALLGLNGEIGELTDLFKKHYYHGHELDGQHVEKEMGDIFFYLFALAHEMGLDVDEIMKINIDKLKARYPDGFDKSKSMNRQKGDI